MFHLFTHAFFKALLFLGAGSVIHAMHHEQDMRNMGGLRRYIPFTAAMMAIGTLALTGFPFTAGYLLQGRDHRGGLRLAHGRARPSPSCARSIAAFMTSFYSWRLFFLTFEGARALGRARHDARGAPDAHEARRRTTTHSHDVRAATLTRTHEHGTATAITRRTRARSTMLVPLARAGARRARRRLRFQGVPSSAHGYDAVLEGRALHRPGQPHPRGDAPRPVLGGAGRRPS